MGITGECPIIQWQLPNQSARYIGQEPKPYNKNEYGSTSNPYGPTTTAYGKIGASQWQKHLFTVKVVFFKISDEVNISETFWEEIYYAGEVCIAYLIDSWSISFFTRIACGANGFGDNQKVIKTISLFYVGFYQN